MRGLYVSMNTPAPSLVSIIEFFCHIMATNILSGVAPAGDGCCSDQDGVDAQFVSLTDTSQFPSANLKA